MLQIPHSADDLKTAVDAQLAWTGNEDAGFYARAGTTLYTIESVGAHLSRPYEVRTVDLGGGGDPAAILDALFAKHKTRRQYCRVTFDLRVFDGLWAFKARSGRWSRGGPREDLYKVRQRAVDALTPEHFADLNPAMMLAPNCMCCGKGLTDPVSMARWIGPECWGSASTNLPNIFKAKAA